MQPYARRYVECRFCAKHVTRNNIGTHVRAKHPARVADGPASWLLELPATEALAIPAQVAVRTPEPPPGLALPAVADRESPPDLPPLSADEIVQAVAEQMAPSGMMSVAHLPALFAWREATATFLRAVSHDRD